MRFTVGIVALLTVGCTNAPVTRTEAENIASDYADAAASAQAKRIDELASKVEQLELELAEHKAALDAVAKVVDGNAEIANKNVLAAATARGECGTQLIRNSNGVFENRRIECTKDNYFER